MFDLKAYNELGNELNLLLKKTQEFLAEERYDSIDQILYQNKILFNRHEVMVKELIELLKSKGSISPEEIEAVDEMQNILRNWEKESEVITQKIKQVQKNTSKALKNIQSSKQVLNTYFHRDKPASRFVNKQQ